MHLSWYLISPAFETRSTTFICSILNWSEGLRSRTLTFCVLSPDSTGICQRCCAKVANSTSIRACRICLQDRHSFLAQLLLTAFCSTGLRRFTKTRSSSTDIGKGLANVKLIAGRCASRNERLIGLFDDGSIGLSGNRFDDILTVKRWLDRVQETK